jgi:hypothetical protein
MGALLHLMRATFNCYNAEANLQRRLLWLDSERRKQNKQH